MSSAAARVAVPSALYATLLGPAWEVLDASVRRAHLAGGVATGRFAIRYGNSVGVRLLRRVLRLPPAGDAYGMRLVITRDGLRERWARTVGGRSFVSLQRGLPDGRLAERFGIVEIRFHLAVADGRLRYASAGAAVLLGPWALRLPRSVAPRVETLEEPAEGHGAHVRVNVSLPLIGFFVVYEGTVVPEGTVEPA